MSDRGNGAQDTFSERGREKTEGRKEGREELVTATDEDYHQSVVELATWELKRPCDVDAYERGIQFESRDRESDRALLRPMFLA